MTDTAWSIAIDRQRIDDARIETGPLPQPGDGEVLRNAALAHPDVQRFIAGKTIRNVVVVPAKLVNVVVE